MCVCERLNETGFCNSKTENPSFLSVLHSLLIFQNVSFLVFHTFCLFSIISHTISYFPVSPYCSPLGFNTLHLLLFPSLYFQVNLNVYYSTWFSTAPTWSSTMSTCFFLFFLWSILWGFPQHWLSVALAFWYTFFNISSFQVFLKLPAFPLGLYLGCFSQTSTTRFTRVSTSWFSPLPTF